MPQCYLCHKGSMHNLQVSHAKNRSKKVRKPNLHSYRIKIINESIKVKLCTKCLRIMKSQNKPQEKVDEKDNH